MRSKGDFPDTLHMFCKEFGVHLYLIFDPAGEQTSRKVKKFCHQVDTTLCILEEKTQWDNRADIYVGMFKESIRKDTQSTNCPMRLWDYCADRRYKIHNVTPCNLFQLNGNTLTVVTHGAKGDIFNIWKFGWYEWCYFWEEVKVEFSFQK